MSREEQVAARLRGDAGLMGILVGKVWRDSLLNEVGLTDPQATGAAYAGGILQPCAIVRQRAPVPALGLLDLKRQHAGASQVVEIHLYQSGGSDGIEAALARIYTLLQGYRLAGAYPARWDGGAAVMDAPEFVGVRTARVDYRIYDIRRPTGA